MSIELCAQLGGPVSIAELFADIESLLPPAARAPLRVLEGAGSPECVVLAPFPVPTELRDGRRVEQGFSTWGRKDVYVGLGTVAAVRLAVLHRSWDEVGALGSDPAAERELEEIRLTRGFHVHLDAGYLRTKATFCLAVLLATAIARRSGAPIHDDAVLLGNGAWVEVSTVLTMFEKYASSQSFEAFADAFCNDIVLAPHWPDSATLVGKDLSTL